MLGGAAGKRSLEGESDKTGGKGGREWSRCAVPATKVERTGWVERRGDEAGLVAIQRRHHSGF